MHIHENVVFTPGFFPDRRNGGGSGSAPLRRLRPTWRLCPAICSQWTSTIGVWSPKHLRSLDALFWRGTRGRAKSTHSRIRHTVRVQSKMRWSFHAFCTYCMYDTPNGHILCAVQSRLKKRIAARSGATCSSTLGGMHGFVSCAHTHDASLLVVVVVACTNALPAENMLVWFCHYNLSIINVECQRNSANRSISSTDKGV
jgi:hypothetical protein